MPDKLTPAQRHTCMSRIRSKNTKPEVRLRKGLFALGYRYRVNVRGLAGSPDIVLPRYRTCIFVNGCFWHGHQGCRRFVAPKSNAEFWRTKVRNNRERDLRNYRDLEARGWRTMVVWECELTSREMPETLRRVQEQLDLNKQSHEAEMQDRRTRREQWKAELRRRKEREAEILQEINK